MSKIKSKIKLGVNIDHAATLRQVRGGTTSYPDLLSLCQLCKKAGADQITIHLREDRRHIQLHDLKHLSEKCPLPLNLEMAATEQMVRLARTYRPDWVCFVPEKRQELTTEGGLDVAKNKKKLSHFIQKLQPIGIQISCFVEPSIQQVKASFEIGADAIELHTGKWVRLNKQAKAREWQRLSEAAELAHSLGMRVHAGHGLDFNTTHEIRKLPYLQEVNIGHSIICYSLEMGIVAAVKKIISKLKK
jgi:pyridoxine 5-phosphate synthase